MEVKIKKLHINAVIPKYSKSGDAGLDLVAIDYTYYFNNKQWIYRTGLAIEIPDGYVGLLFPRSSIKNYSLSLSNSVGVIDSGYRGEIKFIFNENENSISRFYTVGDRIGQLIILPYPKIELVEVRELSETERGENGFGSTGN